MQPLTTLEIIQELNKPFSLMRQRLAFYIMLQRLRLELEQSYLNAIEKKRWSRRILKQLIKRKKLKRRLWLKRRLLVAQIILDRERRKLYEVLKKIHQYEFQLAQEKCHHLVFLIQQQTLSELHFGRLTVSELAFLESQIQLFSFGQKNNLAKIFRMSEQQAEALFLSALESIMKRHAYVLQCSWDAIRKVAENEPQWRLQMQQVDEALFKEGLILGHIEQAIETNVFNLSLLKQSLYHGNSSQRCGFLVEMLR